MAEEIHDAYAREFQGHLLSYIKPLKSTINFIAGYQGPLRVALASMSRMDTIVKETKHFGIFNKFSLIVSRDDVTRQKPDPEIYLLTAKRLRLKPSECAVVEDSLVGAQSALAAGMKCYVFLNGINKKSEFSGLSIRGFIKTLQDYRNAFK